MSLASYRAALPRDVNGDPLGIRTLDRPLRRRMLYPLSYEDNGAEAGI